MVVERRLGYGCVLWRIGYIIGIVNYLIMYFFNKVFSLRL